MPRIAAILALALALGTMSALADDPKPPAPMPAPSWKNGQRITREYCVSCHNARTAPTFAKLAQNPKLTDAYLLKGLTDGIPVMHGNLKMPPTPLLQNEVRDVVAYIGALRD
ncbi:MAG: cytochrome c [Alphaproteobacteria bacterium]|nr:cytochrome c [Alphaproteobacteria bacterium]